jgi:hypothetical protein
MGIPQGTITSTGMVVFTSATLAGLQRLKLAALARRENGVPGGVRATPGIAVMVFER